MNYPINDIFEGTADLLMEHGDQIHSYTTPELNMTDTYIRYGSQMYKIRYVDDKLSGIFRLVRKEAEDGQD